MLLLTDSTDFYFTLHICTIHKSVLRTSVRISSIDSQKHTYLDYDWYLYRKSCGKISFELQINRRCTPVKFNLAFSWREKKLKKAYLIFSALHWRMIGNVVGKKNVPAFFSARKRTKQLSETIPPPMWVVMANQRLFNIIPCLKLNR